MSSWLLGATEIISIHVSRSLSGVLDTAQLAVGEAPVPVTLFDSGSLTLGVGFLAWAAAEMVAEGAGRDGIIAALNDLRKCTHVMAAPDTLEQLRQRAQHLLPEGQVLSVDVTPVLGTHLGPGAVGFACVSAKDGA